MTTPLGEASRSERSSRSVEQNKEEIIQAALLVFAERGILGGLRASEVAERAGSHRSWVYKYFGGRRGLMREALRHEVGQWIPEIRRSRHLPFVERFVNAIQATASHPSHVRLLTTLILDGDPEASPMPIRAKTQESLEKDIKDGYLDEGTDLMALSTILGSLMWGYSLYRDSFARDFQIDPFELQERATPYFRRLLASLATFHSDAAEPTTTVTGPSL